MPLICLSLTYLFNINKIYVSHICSYYVRLCICPLPEASNQNPVVKVGTGLHYQLVTF